MKFIFLLIIALASFSSIASTVSNCYLVNGRIANAHNAIFNLKFETVVDVFTLRNANVLSFNLEGQDLRLVKTSMDSGPQTKLIYSEKRDGETVRAVTVIIDRSPRTVVKTREFYGSMVVSPEIESGRDYTSLLGKKFLTYSFYCSF